MTTLFDYDEAIRNEPGTIPLCGVDEAGRGPLAGPVYAAAVILPADIDPQVLKGLADSKKLTEKKRELLFDVIVKEAQAHCIAEASVAEIEEMNILNAAMLAMRRAVEGLKIAPALVLVDGNALPGTGFAERWVVKGDDTSASIAAASILAKVARDRHMLELAAKYPDYQFEKHKGYGTKLHYEMLAEHGVSPAHRESFLRKWRKSHERT